MGDYEKAIAYAKAEGLRDGTGAASWFFDGASSEAAYQNALDGIEEGDPEVLDLLPQPDLSGQHADWTSGPVLVASALNVAGLGDEPQNEDRFSEICDAYEASFHEAAEAEITRVARIHLS